MYRESGGGNRTDTFRKTDSRLVKEKIWARSFTEKKKISEKYQTQDRYM